MSFAPRFAITNSMTAGLTRIERARGFLEAAHLSDDWIRLMGQRALLLEAHHTTHIEGTQLTLAQAERVFAGEDVPEADPDDVRELLNYRRAFEFVSDYLDSGVPVSEGLVREIHKRLVEGVRGGAGGAGEYRRMQNYVVNSATGATVYTPAPPAAVPPLMEELVAWLNAPSDIHPVLVSGLAQFQLVHIHPFVDGNGRTSRLLSTLALYRAGYDFKRLFTISEFYDRDRLAFYAAIQGVRDQGLDFTGWLEFFIDGLATQLDEFKERGQRVILRDVWVKQHRLNDRHATVLDQFLDNASFNLRALQELLSNNPRRTLQRDLQVLTDCGLLTSDGATHQAVYRLNKDFAPSYRQLCAMFAPNLRHTVQHHAKV